MKAIPLRQLTPGSRFRVAGIPRLTGQLVELGVGSAVVIWERARAPRVFTAQILRRTAAGVEKIRRQVVIPAKRRRERCALGTMVVPLRDPLPATPACSRS